jgi:DNA primase
VDTSTQDVILSLNYFKLHKIKKMFEENQRDIEQTKNWPEMVKLLEIHKYLKATEREITEQLGTVIMK